MITAKNAFFSGKRELALVVGVVGILLLLFTPIPPQLLDVLLILNITTSLLILLVTFYTDTPLKFSTFPSLLLITTLFRLALNIASTRLVLEGAYAGEVIEAMGNHVIAGNYVVGLVVFLILVVVQYVVVTNGAQRVAEVAARFILDSMPGKQMSIDADMNMGLIDEHEARHRRQQIEKEANFYGAMDGASKFVKGDAIAGIIIILINIIGGLAIGMIQLGMSWGEAAQRYTLLTVGDGLVTQIPSLVIAVATGIIITRAATDAQLGLELSKQVFGNPKALGVVGMALLGFLLIPGLPVMPVLGSLLVVGLLAWFAWRRLSKESDEEPSAEQKKPADPSRSPNDDLYALARVEPLELRSGNRLLEELIAPTAFAERLDGVRKQFAVDLGLVFPKFRCLSVQGMEDDRYELWINGGRVGSGDIRLGKILAINPGSARARLEGEETRDPAFGLAAQWIDAAARAQGRAAGYTIVDAETVLITHLNELLKRYAPDLLSRAETERMLARLKAQHGSLLDEVVPSLLSFTDVQRILQGLLREQVSIRSLDAILEALADAAKVTKSSDELVERVRERLGPVICQRLADNAGELHVLTLAPDIERQFLNHRAASNDGRSGLALEMGQLDALMRALSKQIDAMIAANHTPVLLCPSPIRRSLRQLIQRAFPFVAVVAVSEVPAAMSVRAFSQVTIPLNSPVAMS
jgi:flagellar biosynthesis protein FlhA